MTQSAFGKDVSSPFVPVGVTPRYPPPRANIRPETGGSWIGRVLPIALAHKGIFALSIASSFLGLIVQVLVPNEIRLAIDSSLVGGASLDGHIVAIVVLAVAVEAGAADQDHRLRVRRPAPFDHRS